MEKRKQSLLGILVAMLLLVTFGAAAGAENLIYPVKPGDTLWKISTRFQTPMAAIREASGLTSDTLNVGQIVHIPNAPGFWNYTVKSGDTFYLIAKRFGTTIAALQRTNNLWTTYLTVGQILVIPPVAAPAPTPSPAPGNGQLYTVQPGDTLFLISQRFGVPLNALRQANNLQSDYLTVGQQLVIPDRSQLPPPTTVGQIPPLSDADKDLLARLVTAEAAGEPYEGQVAVAATILNRIKSPNYPNNVHDVIYQVVDGVYYQFSPVLDGRINEPASPTAFKAVEDALKGWDPSQGAIGFYNPAKTTNPWVKAQPVTVVIGQHVFFRE